MRDRSIAPFVLVVCVLAGCSQEAPSPEIEKTRCTIVTSSFTLAVEKVDDDGVMRGVTVSSSLPLLGPHARAEVAQWKMVDDHIALFLENIVVVGVASDSNPPQTGPEEIVTMETSTSVLNSTYILAFRDVAPGQSPYRLVTGNPVGVSSGCLSLKDARIAVYDENWRVQSEIGVPKGELWELLGMQK